MKNIQISEQLRYAALLLEYQEGVTSPVRRLHEMADAIALFDFPLSLFSNKDDLDRIRALFFPKAHGEVFAFLRDLIHEEGGEREDIEEKTSNGKSAAPFLLRLEREVTPETIALIRLPEMGAERAALLREALGIRNVDNLTRDCRRHLVQKIEGFDANLEKRWLQGKWYSSGVKTGFSPISWPVAELIVQFLTEQLAPLLKIVNEEENFSPWEIFQNEMTNEEMRRFTPPSVYPTENLHYAPKLGGPPIRGNVRYRKPLLERIRAFFTPKEPNYVDPKFFDPFGMERVSPLPPDYVSRSKETKQQSISSLVFALEPVGDYRRLEETVKSLDFLISTKHPQAVFDQIGALPFIRSVSSPNDMELTVAIDRDRLVYGNNRKFPGSILHFYVCFPDSFVTESVYRTSSREHWKELKRRAAKKGFLLDQSGLFRGKKPVRFESEADFYQTLGLPLLPPETRNGLFEFDLTGKMPELLIQKEDIRGDLHLHSIFTDGTGTIEEMAEKGMAQGLDYIAMTDHSKQVAIAGGMDEVKIRQYWETIDQINRDFKDHRVPFTILKGVEVDMLADGRLDFNDDILSRADWVMASLHFEQNQPRELIHKRVAAALANPYVSAISHPTGKTFQSNFRLDMDLDFLFETAKKFGKCLELNSQPRRFDLDWRLCRRAKEHGIKIVISTDSHAPDEMEYLRYGVQLARKAGLTKEDVINTLPVSEILALRHRLPIAEPTLKTAVSHDEKSRLSQNP